jgi:hypothetical protein
MGLSFDGNVSCRKLLPYIKQRLLLVFPFARCAGNIILLHSVA